MSTHFAADREFARGLDEADPLHPLKREFLRPKQPDGTDTVYFCGHSLGLESRRAVTYVNEELEEWHRRGVEGHFDGRRP